MNYNEMFRVFDNGGETVDRYTVFLGNEPEEGALGLSDDPTNPSYGFSQFGDFDIDVVEKNNTEISFDQLPKNVQQHVLDRFELTEGEEFTVDDMWHGVISSILDEDKETAAAIIKEIVVNKFDELVNTPLNELNMGKIKFVGDDVYVNNKKVGSIENDLEDHSRGIVLKLDSGEEHDFDQIDDLMNFIMDTFRITEFNEGPIQVRGDYVFVNGKKVGKISTDLDNMKSGIKLMLAKGEGYEFESMPQLYKFLQGKFNVREEFISEATLEQKAVVKALRQLARKLEIPNPRFRSLGGKAGFVEMSPKNWRDEVIPNDLRKKAVVKVFNAVPSNFSDVDYGNVRRESITLTVPQWKQLLSYYGIEVPETLGEGYTIMPAIDKDRYPDREHQGLEGPFRARNGKVVYYDPKEGKYYDPDSDLYLEFGEWEAMNKPRDETERK